MNRPLPVGRLSDAGSRRVAPSLLVTGGAAGDAEASIAIYTEVFPQARLEGVLRGP